MENYLPLKEFAKKADVSYAITYQHYRNKMTADQKERFVQADKESGIKIDESFIEIFKAEREQARLERLNRKKKNDTESKSEADVIAVEADDTDVVSNPFEIFKNEEFGQIRVVNRDGHVWFVAKDVCNALDLTNSRKSILRLDDDEKGVTLSDTLGGNQKMSIINESGLYSLVLSSKKQSAKNFKRWITHEVIPSIREHGGYIQNQENLTDDELLSKALLVAQSKIAEREQRINALIEQNKNLHEENNLLMGETNTWEHTKIINALIRAFGSMRCHGNFQIAWNVYYKRLLYFAGIGLMQRNKVKGKNSFLSRLRPEEYNTAISVASAMCRESNINIVKVVFESNMAIVKKAEKEFPVNDVFVEIPESVINTMADASAESKTDAIESSYRNRFLKHSK